MTGISSNNVSNMDALLERLRFLDGQCRTYMEKWRESAERVNALLSFAADLEKEKHSLKEQLHMMVEENAALQKALTAAERHLRLSEAEHQSVTRRNDDLRRETMETSRSHTDVHKQLLEIRILLQKTSTITGVNPQLPLFDQVVHLIRASKDRKPTNAHENTHDAAICALVAELEQCKRTIAQQENIRRQLESELNATRR